MAQQTSTHRQQQQRLTTLCFGRLEPHSSARNVLSSDLSKSFTHPPCVIFFVVDVRIIAVAVIFSTRLSLTISTLATALAPTARIIYNREFSRICIYVAFAIATPVAWSVNARCEADAHVLAGCSNRSSHASCGTLSPACTTLSVVFKGIERLG